MNSSQDLQIRVYWRRELCQTVQFRGQMQIGRQKPGEPPPFYFDQQGERMVVAALDDKLVSREHLLLRRPPSLPHSREPVIEICNQSRKRSVLVDQHGKLGPQETLRIQPPVLISFEEFAIRVEASESGVWDVRSLEHATLAPGQRPDPDSRYPAAQRSIVAATSKESYTTEQLIHWLGETMDVLQSATASSDYLAHAVEAVHRIVGLDTIAALRFDGQQWSMEAIRDLDDDQLGSDTRAPSRTILQQIVGMKRTVRHLPAGQQAAASLQGVKALVASPILNAMGDVIGALYGARYHRQATQLPQITELEATMVEVIACSAAAGIAREAEEKKAIEARVRFEQFFTPQLAHELERNPGLLDGHDAEISVLFCDIVGFSSISQRIGSRLTMQWISDCMDYLSLAVLNHEGVLVDYIGDELMAMWGAPLSQPDHAHQACQAAAAMLGCRQAINAVWQARIGYATDFRIGIAAGQASVGNTGSSRKFKYGPLGETVNLASRLQGAAKHFGVRQLINGRTAEALRDCATMVTRRLGSTKLVNLLEPIEVFELLEEPSHAAQQLARGFQSVLGSIAEGNLQQAQSAVSALATEFPDDRPTAMLAERLHQENPLDPLCLWSFDTK